MRKETKNFRVATLAAPLALAVALTAAFGANAEVYDKNYWSAQPDGTAWVNSAGECWQSTTGPESLEPCVVEVAPPLVLRLQYELDKYRIENITNPDALQDLDNYIEQVKQTPRDEMLTIVGHTDKLGSFEHNMVLSENRAMGIRDYMVERGINPDRIQSVTGVAWEGGQYDVGPDGTQIDLGPLENNPFRRRTVVTEIVPPK